MGLVLNRPTDSVVAEAVEKELARGRVARGEPVFIGGPVQERR